VPSRQGGSALQQHKDRTLQARTWWINQPLVMAASNPPGEDLAELRADGFSVIFSFLDEQKQPPKYDKESAGAAGWIIYSIPIEEGNVPSFDQLAEFITCVQALPREVKIVMHCESGLGRTAFMAAAYWIANQLTANEAIARMRQAASDEG
jgi:protein-tyrosine phosphatase